ncbi:hypothetical protein F9U64_15780 [Gracilibacillus oryzae]|uniref:Uncharacterized protein n=1 Tax=Gracilibacillus oryzae TaxID=1672701 RepID=A0A7C8KTK8_9BACI|nr:hypothetical protein [Gracilibacillus oryzae]KAB8128862.1 hypothetical protein F9U64_15780 [Gracilibacillus oryzae]
MHKKKYLIMSLTLIFVLGFILASCNDIERTPEGYKLPIAKYEQLDSEHFSVHIEFYEEDNGKEAGEKYATIVIHHFSESPISIPDDAIIPFQIKGTDLKGEAQLDILTTINDPEINSEEIQHLIENEKPMTVVLENYGEVNLIYRTPRVPSQ